MNQEEIEREEKKKSRAERFGIIEEDMKPK